MDMTSLVNIYVFPTGRRVYALAEVEQRATARGVAAVAAHAARGVAHDRQTLALELRRQAGRPGFYGSDAQTIDTVIDRAVTGMDIYLDAQVRIFTEDDARGSAAARLRRTLFPQGSAAITQLSFVQQHSQIDALLARLEQADLSADLAALPDLAPMIARIRELNAQYSVSLAAYDRNVPTLEEVRDAQLRGQQLLVETLVLILAHHVTAGDEVVSRDLLEPIVRQNAAIRAARQRRRLPPDVDPDTGNELPLPEPGQPADSVETPQA